MRISSKLLFIIAAVLISIMSILPHGSCAEPEAKQAKATVEECLDYSAAFLAQEEYDNGIAWIDYGLKIHQNDPRLGIAQQAVRLLHAKPEERDNLIGSIRELMKNAGISKPDESLRALLIYSGFYLHKISVDGFIIVDKVVFEMQEAPVDVLFVGFIKKSVKISGSNDLKIKSKNEWTAYILLRNNSDIDFGRKNAARLILETDSTPPAKPATEGLDQDMMLLMPGARDGIPANTPRKAPERKAIQRTPKFTTAEEQPRQPDTFQQDASETDLVSRNNENMHYEIDLTIGPREFKHIILDKPSFFLDNDLKPEGYTVTVSWVQNTKDPYTCQAFTDTIAVTEDQLETQPVNKN
ncbi:MAG: hypothetical protein WC074_07380 [bacterium]|jgi:hypothetical protein|nr:hypothetical protein [bacterium]